MQKQLIMNYLRKIKAQKLIQTVHQLLLTNFRGSSVSIKIPRNVLQIFPSNQ